MIDINEAREVEKEARASLEKVNNLISQTASMFGVSPEELEMNPTLLPDILREPLAKAFIQKKRLEETLNNLEAQKYAGKVLNSKLTN